jgi:hypothetical protein
MTKQATPKLSRAFTFGVSFATREKLAFADIEELARIIPVLSYDDYLKFREEFKAGALSEGYQESGFNQLWSEKVLSPLKTLGIFPPAKPVVTKDSEKVKKSREKAKAAQNVLESKTPAELEAMRHTLFDKIKAGDASALKADLTIVKALNKARKASEAKAKQADSAELRALKEEIRDILKTADKVTLEKMIRAVKGEKVVVPTSTIARKAA